MDDSLRRTRIEILLIFLLYLIILPRVYMDYDMGFWRQWAVSIHRYGIANAYDHDINYLPVYLYGLYFYDLLQGTEANIVNNINNIKILFVFFDFLPLFVLCCFRQKLLQFKIHYIFLLLNIAYVFNSMVWGQMDSIYTNLAFLAILTGLFYPVAGLVLYVIALNTKQQAVEFLPVIAIVLAYSTRKIRTLVLMLVSVIATELLILLPFINNGGLPKLFHIVTHSVDLYNKLSICAFNFWYLIQNSNPYFINDKDTFFIFSYKTIGLILFFITSGIVLIPLLKQFLRLRQGKQSPGREDYKVLFLATGMISLFFFYFNSQMHERYANPVIIFFFFYGVVAGDYKLYILASIPYFLSLDKCFTDYLPIVHYKWIFASKMIALWYTATLFYGSYLYWKLRGKSTANA